MMKKKGFTLIELLAVIIVLAVIALIATPLVFNTVEESRKGAFTQTINGVIKAAELYQAKEQMIQSMNECRYFSFGNDVTKVTRRDDKLYYPVKDLNLKGDLPTEGEVKICESEIVIEVSDGNYAGRYEGGNVNISKGDLASNDLTTPIIDNINTNITTNRIIVIVNAHSPSVGGIIQNYYYKINDGEYIKSEEASYIFDDLDPETEYTITVKVENKSGITAEESKDVKTNSFGELSIDVENSGEWTTSKEVTITGEGATIEYQIIKYTGTEVTSTSEWMVYSEPFEIKDIDATVENPVVVLAHFNDGKNISDPKSSTITTIDITNPILSVTSIEKTTNSLTINYDASDNESDIKQTICEYGTTESYGEQVTGQNGKCSITGLSTGTVYYKITTTNKANLTAEATGSTSIEKIETPTLVFTNTPETSTDGYYTKQVVAVNYSGSVTNPIYYAMTTRATVSDIEAVATCGTDTEPGECTDITATTGLSAGVWYKFNSAPTFTYSAPATENAVLLAIIGDGKNISDAYSADLGKIYYEASSISYTNSSVSSVTNVEEALDYLYDNLK